MNIIHSASSFLSIKPPNTAKPPIVRSSFWCTLGFYPNTHLHASHIHYPITSSSSPYAYIGPSNQETFSAVHFEDLVEKDWSFLDNEETNYGGDYVHKIGRIISAGEIAEMSKVLVSIGSESFVDRLVNSSPCEQLHVVHDSFFVMACIKEMYDKANCWQGELINVPEKWTCFNVVYQYFLPTFSFELDQVLAALVNRCLPGARIVTSHP